MYFNQTHVHCIKVEFEEIDAGGVVHHPNYLKFYERARAAAIEDAGYSYERMLKEGLAIAVAECYLSYRKPVLYGQKIFVLSRILGIRRSSLRVMQAITSHEPSLIELEKTGSNLEVLQNLIHLAQLRLVCVSLNEIKPIRVPEELRKVLKIPVDSELSELAKEVRISGI